MDSLLKKYELESGECGKKVTECHLQEIANNICENWKWLQPHLKLAKLVVKDINSKFSDEKDKRLEFFQRWVEQEGSGATYSKLVDALLAIKCKEDAEFVLALLQKQKVNGSSGVSGSPSLEPADSKALSSSVIITNTAATAKGN